MALLTRASRSMSGAGVRGGQGQGRRPASLQTARLSLDDAALMKQIGPALGDSEIHAVMVQPLTGPDDKVRLRRGALVEKGRA